MDISLQKAYTQILAIECTAVWLCEAFVHDSSNSSYISWEAVINFDKVKKSYTNLIL